MNVLSFQVHFDVDLTSAFYGGSSPSPTSLKKVGRKEDRKVACKLLSICVIPGFRRSENAIFALLGCYATVIGRYRRFGVVIGSIFNGQAVFLRMGPIGCAETSVTNCQ